MIFLGILNTIRSILTSMFSLICFTLARYMAFQQFKEYFSNQDFTTISRRTFIGENDDMYPSLSICLYGKGGRIFRNQNFGINQKLKPMCNVCQTKNCISNDTKMVMCSAEDYYLAMSGSVENSNISSLPFEWITYDARDFVLNYKTKKKEGVTGMWFHTPLFASVRNRNISWLGRSYQDPQHICMTKKRKYESNKLLKYHYWKMTIRQMLSLLGGYDIRIFVHQKGQLLRKLGAPHFTVDNQFMKNEKPRFERGITYKIDTQVNGVHVLHKRHDSFEACDDKLYNEDDVWTQQAIRLLNCTPTF